MSQTTKITPAKTSVIPTSAPRGKGSIGQRILSTPGIVIGGAMLLLIAAIAFILPPILGLDPYAVDPMSRLQPASAEHPLGTDTFGRSLLARILYGARASLTVGFLVALVSGVLGTIIGLVAAFNNTLDHILMRICDGLMAIPAILLAVALAAALGPTMMNLIIALTIVYTPNLARLIRSRAVAIRNETFVEASIGAGARPLHVMAKHIFPNTLSVLVVQSTFTFAESVIVEAALSFLGAGVPPPIASWGNILYDGKAVINTAPGMVTFTSLALVITVLSLNILGDGMRDFVDQRSKRHISRFQLFRMPRARRSQSRVQGERS